MSEAEALSARIDALEMRLTYQDATIDELNAAITAQWREIDRLVRQLAEMKEHFEEMSSPGQPAAPEPPPPHY